MRCVAGNTHLFSLPLAVCACLSERTNERTRGRTDEEREEQTTTSHANKKRERLAAIDNHSASVTSFGRAFFSLSVPISSLAPYGALLAWRFVYEGNGAERRKIEMLSVEKGEGKGRLYTTTRLNSKEQAGERERQTHLSTTTTTLLVRRRKKIGSACWFVRLPGANSNYHIGGRKTKRVGKEKMWLAVSFLFMVFLPVRACQRCCW